MAKMKHLWRTYKSMLVAAAIAVLATAGVIYLTPLRHITFLSPTMNSMSPQEFYAEFSANPDKYMLVDVRSASIYESAHAKNARSIPIENFYDDHYHLPRSGKQIALICTTGRLAAIAYGYLENWGFRNLIHIQGGMVAWTAAGLPVEGSNVLTPSLVDDHQ